jgi:hypothetical protein
LPQLSAALLLTALAGHGVRQAWRAYHGEEQQRRERQAVLHHYRLRRDGRTYDPARNPELTRILQEHDGQPGNRAHPEDAQQPGSALGKRGIGS